MEMKEIKNKKNILVTGGAGFIGGNFVKTVCCRDEVKRHYNFVILDALTYAGHYGTIAPDIERENHLLFEKVDLRDQAAVNEVFQKFSFQGVLHFAAESHVDRSIEGPQVFLETNVLGTLNLLNSSLKYCRDDENFRYLQVSTDEVYGSLNKEDPSFHEASPLGPNSPYSVSKASADLLVMAYLKTYGLPVLITRCSNNYGPYQNPEKLIPLMIDRARADLPLPIYGKGENIRDWIFVDDHNEGIWKAFQEGKPGNIYHFGGQEEMKNLDVAKTILKTLGKPQELISFVKDRLGHDFRYSINFQKSQEELGWVPKVNFEEGLLKTVDWYLQNEKWVNEVKEKGTALRN